MVLRSPGRPWTLPRLPLLGIWQQHPGLRVGFLALVAASTLACRRSTERVGEAEADRGAAEMASPATSGARVGSLPSAGPTRRAGPRALCPMTIEPGVRLGPVTLGESLPELEDAGLVVTRFSGDQAELVIPGRDGPSVAMKVALCGGKITEVWLDDLRQAPDCVVFRGRPIPRTSSRDELERMLGGGVAGLASAPRIGVVPSGLPEGGCPPSGR